MKLIVTARELQYGGKTYLRDAEFEAADKHAVALKMLRKAADAPPHSRPVRQAASVTPTATEVVEPAASPDVAPDAPDTSGAYPPSPPKRRGGLYGRRDLRAED